MMNFSMNFTALKSVKNDKKITFLEISIETTYKLKTGMVLKPILIQMLHIQTLNIEIHKLEMFIFRIIKLNG